MRSKAHPLLGSNWVADLGSALSRVWRAGLSGVGGLVCHKKFRFLGVHLGGQFAKASQMALRPDVESVALR
jgi:hypothetical protein